MKTLSILLAFTAFLTLTRFARADITLAADGKSDYVIVLQKAASPSEKWAAEDLADHLKKMTGAALNTVTLQDADPVPAKAIILGDGPAARAAGVTVDQAKLGDEGFTLKTAGDRLVIAGAPKRGTMYGVYTLLEKLGCRWWYPGASTIPSVKTLTIPNLDETQIPALDYRDFLYGEMGDSPAAELWRARNKVDGGFYKTMDEKYGGAWTFHTLVHSIGGLVPPAKYFKDHPEYYALRDGKRTSSQVCFSNPETLKIAADSIMKLIEQHPEWRFYTVGQEDNGQYCQCDDCKALAAKTGSLGGMQVDFGNRVAAIVHQKYPNVMINVPAYEWSRHPPTTIKPDPKMSITLCSIECNFGQPLSEGYPEQNAAFKSDIEGWSKITNTLYIWDYTTNFSNYLLPYPNYYSLIPNIKFYVDNHVKGIMHQGSHTTPHGQLSPLCLWLLAQGMWNPDQDSKKLTEEFCLGYYGPDAGKYVFDYLNLLYGAINKDRTPIWCTRGSFLNAKYLTPDVVTEGDHLFRQAEAAVKDNPELLARVHTDHIGVLYVMLARPMDMIEPAAKLTPGLTISQVCREFASYAKAAGISDVREGDKGAQLFAWCNDFAALKEKDPTADLPAELKSAPAGSYRFLHAAQLDSRISSLKKVDGASDGWAQSVTSPGWVIQHRVAAPFDFTVGKKYKLFVRGKATAKDPNDNVLSLGIYNKDGKHACTRNLKPGDVNGQWQTWEIGTWTPAEDGGSFYIATGRAGATDAYLDSLWLVQQNP